LLLLRQGCGACGSTCAWIDAEHEVPPHQSKQEFLLVTILLSESATAMARRIRAREFSAVELLEAHLAQIARLNPTLNALIQLDAEGAYATARAADAALAAGRALAPLHGVPFTVKDWIDAAGLRCTGVEPQFRERVPLADASVVARMRQAGAVLLGKTNVLEDNALFGRTNNPYNPAYSPTGSSSGEAALIAAGGSPLGLGSDSGGSIRQPAHACGVAGLKPTTGRVPLTGHFPFISALNDPRTVIGPLARHVEDLALALAIIGGEDWRDPSVIPMPLGDWRAVRPGELRVAWYTHHADAEPTPEVAAACRQVAELFSAAGARVVEAVPPLMGEVYSLTQRYWRRPEPTSPEAWGADEATELSSLEVEQHLADWDRFRRAMIAWMADYDLVLTPAAEQPARPHGTPAGRITYTLTYSLTGWPAVVVRAGTLQDEMPIGVQLVARPWRDDVALSAGALVERELGGWRAPSLF
jgi:amidase